jgi:flagellar hook-associated protein 2
MSLALSGVFSGIDTDSLVAQLMQVERRPLMLVQQQKARMQSRQQAVDELATSFGMLRGALSGMVGPENLRGSTVTSSNQDVLTASASSLAGEGMHNIEIDQLAAADRLVHDAGLAGLDSTVGASLSNALNLNGVADPDADAFVTTTAAGATYTFDFGDETDIDNVVFDPSTSYTLNEVAGLINARSQAVAGYDAASVALDDQTGLHYLTLTAQFGDTGGVLTTTRTAGDAVDAFDAADDWRKTAAGAGQFVYTYDGVERTIAVSNETTLEGLRDLINNDGQNPGVSASVLQHDGAYHLVLAGRDTGADYAVSVDNLATTLEGFDEGAFLRTQQARNSRVRVDGYPAGDWIERSGNTLTDVIDGVTLNLRQTGSASVSLSRDTSAVKGALENFVSSYNSVVDKLDKYTGYDEETKTRGLLQGDATINSWLAPVRSEAISSVVGFGGEGDSFTLPGQLGLSIDDEGKLLLDTAVLDEAIAEDYLGVLDLIGAENAGVTDSDYLRFNSARDITEAGTYELEIDFNDQGAAQAARIRAAGQTEWRTMQISNNVLTGYEGEDEEGLSLTAVWDGASATQTATVRVRSGFAANAAGHLESLLDEVDGAIQFKQDQYDSRLAGYDARIETLEDRLADKEERYREKFARLEAILSDLEGQRASVQAMLGSLSSSSQNSQS